MTNLSGKLSDEAFTKSIDDIDKQLAELFDERFDILRSHYRDTRQTDEASPVQAVAHEAKRIEQVIASVSSAPRGMDAASKTELLRHLSSICLKSLHEFQVAYLGPEYSYSHLAAIKFFGDSMPVAPVATIPAVFDAVKRNDCFTGIVPIENSTDGRVVDTLGAFLNGGSEICGEVQLPIHHNLMSKTPRNEIQEIHSKPQALSQCRVWLTQNFPNAALLETSSSAGAAELASKQHGVAAIASLEAGRKFDLDVIGTSIEDNPNNVTRFAVLGSHRRAATGDDKTTLLFQLAHQPGALADAMSIFKTHGLNLTWIESFPSPEAASEYYFFVELTGHRDDKVVAKAVAELADQTQQLTILGSYPRAKKK